MTRFRPILQAALILAMLIATCTAVVDYSRQTAGLWSPQRIGQDAASTWPDRLLLVQQDLPPTGVIGYISEQDYPGAPFSPIGQDEEYVLTQYVMAPLILDRGSVKHEFVLGNFSNPYDYDFTAVLGVYLIYDYGYGISLFKGTEQ
jgi:hypothetical protein